ncbi:MAG: hypothetical protein KAW09_09660 [Thermoplasmata archaeon]|nr:hypothetical protein [Thermoplasmata archaeon]
MRAVSDATPLIFLAKIGRLNLLEEIFETVLISEEVFSEVVVEGKEKGHHDAYLVEEFIERGFVLIKQVAIEKLRDMPIGRGEVETIELAVEEKIRDVLMDEAKGRRIARLHNLRPKGTLWVLTKAFEDDLLSKEELKNCIQELTRCGYRIREDILVEILGELM